MPIVSGAVSDLHPAEVDQHLIVFRNVGPATHNQFTAMLVDCRLLREL